MKELNVSQKRILAGVALVVLVLTLAVLILFVLWVMLPAMETLATAPFYSPLPPRPTPDLDPPDWEGLWECYGQCSQNYADPQLQELCYAWCSTCGEFWENVYGPGIYDELMDYEECLDLLPVQGSGSVLYLPLVYEQR